MSKGDSLGMDDNRCRGCGELCSTVYCQECADAVECWHGNKVGDCDQCGIDGDLAFDANREKGR